MNLIDAKVAEGGIESGSGRLKLAGFPVGSRIVLGVRPEDLSPTGDAAGAVVSGRVVTLEALGAETLVHVDAGIGKPIIMRGGRETAARLGEMLHLTCNPAMARFFDPETGQARKPGDTS